MLNKQPLIILWMLQPYRKSPGWWQLIRGHKYSVLLISYISHYNIRWQVKQAHSQRTALLLDWEPASVWWRIHPGRMGPWRHQPGEQQILPTQYLSLLDHFSSQTALAQLALLGTHLVFPSILFPTIMLKDIENSVHIPLQALWSLHLFYLNEIYLHSILVIKWFSCITAYKKCHLLLFSFAHFCWTCSSEYPLFQNACPVSHSSSTSPVWNPELPPQNPGSSHFSKHHFFQAPIPGLTSSCWSLFSCSSGWLSMGEEATILRLIQFTET